MGMCICVIRVSISLAFRKLGVKGLFKELRVRGEKGNWMLEKYQANIRRK